MVGVGFSDEGKGDQSRRRGPVKGSGSEFRVIDNANVTN